MPPKSSRRDWNKIAQVLKRLVLFLLLAAIGTGGFVLEEKWRGARDWKRMQAHLQERGIVLELEPIPESSEIQAFRQLPLIRELYETPWPGASSFPKLLRLHPATLTTRAHWEKDAYQLIGSVNWGWTVNWQDALGYYRQNADQLGVNPEEWSGMAPPEVVLSLLRRVEPILKDFEAYQHPEGWQYPVLTHELSASEWFARDALKSWSDHYLLKARAHLELGRNEDAFEDLNCLHHVVQIACRHASDRSIATAMWNWRSAIWEGWRQDAWKANQWKQLEEQLLALDFESFFSRFLVQAASAKFRLLDRPDREVFWQQVFDSAGPYKHFDGYTLLTTPSLWLQGWSKRFRKPSFPILMNTGWYDQNKVTLAMELETLLDAFLNTVRHRQVVKRFGYTNWPDSGDGPFYVTRWPSHSFLAQFNTLHIHYRRFCDLETMRVLTLAAVRCSLHRLETGAWPNQLEEVLPENQPNLFQDPYGQGLLKYLPPAEAHGKPRIYSVSWDGVDHRGSSYPKDMTWFEGLQPED